MNVGKWIVKTRFLGEMFIMLVIALVAIATDEYALAVVATLNILLWHNMGTIQANFEALRDKDNPQ